MGTLLSFSISSGIVLMAMYLIYRFALASQKQCSYNRGVIISIYLLAPAIAVSAKWLLPFLFANGADPVGSMDIDVAAGDMMEAAVGASESSGERLWLGLVVFVWIVGMIFFLVWTVTGHLKAVRIAHGGQRRRLDRYNLVISESSDVVPFSFGRTIVINRDDYISDGPTIIAHEVSHLGCRHWIDLILARAVIVINWFNPAAWLLEEELKSVHEYQADMAVLDHGIDARRYQMMLIKKAVGRSFPAIANSLNHSKLNKRITMMLKTNSSKGKRLRVLALVPAAVAALSVISIPAVASALTAIGNSDLSFDTGKITKKIDKSSQSVVMDRDLSVKGVNAFNDKGAKSVETVFADAGSARPVGDVLPHFPGGERALLQFIMDNLKYPEGKDLPDEERVVVKFMVSADGKVKNPSVINGKTPVYIQEAVRVVSLLPDFEPGKVDGKPVDMNFVVPVTFKRK